MINVVGKNGKIYKYKERKDYRIVRCNCPDVAAACPYALYNTETGFWECYEDTAEECSATDGWYKEL